MEPVGFANSYAALRGVGLAGLAALSCSREGCLLWSFVYLVFRNLFALAPQQDQANPSGANAWQVPVVSRRCGRRGLGQALCRLLRRSTAPRERSDIRPSGSTSIRLDS
jgi:hypothetical protein